MKSTTKMLAIGAVVILAVAGVAMALTSSNSLPPTNDGTPIVSMNEQAALTDQSLELQVSALKNGKEVPLVGAQVAVCTMEIIQEQERTTLRVMNVTEGYTDANGSAAFGLPEGKYFVYAYSYGQRGFCQGNLSDEEMMMVRSHQWSWGKMEGEVFQYMEQTQNNAGSAMLMQIGTIDPLQDMVQSRDRLRDGSCQL